MRIAFLGPEGTFSHEAATTAAGGDGGDLELLPQPTVHHAVLAVREGSADRAVVPMENSLEGAVNATLDALAGEPGGVCIVGEVVLPIRHALVAAPGVRFDALDAVLSHPQATAQCARFLRSELPDARVLAAPSTAEAVRMVAAGLPPAGVGAWAALGTPLAAELYGCEVLRAGVEDEEGNATRFVWLAAAGEEARSRGPHKTSLVFWGAGSGAPGWLVRCLSELAFRGVNLTRIESRPSREGLGSYRFFCDLDGHADDPPVADAIAGLGAQAEVVRVLGSYPAAP